METDFFMRIEDLYNRCNSKNIITYTNFLTPAEQNMLNNKKYKNMILAGGSSRSERRRAFFLPFYITEEEFDEKEYISVLKVTFSYKPLSHRDFLGTLMGLNIKRECIGDIYVFERQAFVLVNKDMSSFILMNLKKIGNVGVKVEEIDLNQIILPELKTEKITFTVNSLRLDSILAGTFKISRESAIEKIKSGLATLNYLTCMNPSENLKQEDIISLRGFGKAKLSVVGSLSKKGRIFVNIEKMC